MLLLSTVSNAPSYLQRREQDEGGMGGPTKALA